MEPTNFKKSYSWIWEKHDQTSINLTNVLTLQGNFQITLGLMESNCYVPFLYMLLKNS